MLYIAQGNTATYPVWTNIPYLFIEYTCIP
uniref:Uncharacterized protein n=1 Tax=Arundo donax TaxID=35708 RepID=A0A0A8Z529_ARUDO